MSTMSSSTPALDPEEFVQCPYEENHKVRNKRMQIHLIECIKVSCLSAVLAFSFKNFCCSVSVDVM